LFLKRVLVIFLVIYIDMKNQSKLKNMKKIEILKELFWDYKLEQVVGKQKIKNFLKKYENLLSEQSLNFYKLCYGVKSKKTFNRTSESS
jgi:hypothetical protein